MIHYGTLGDQTIYTRFGLIRLFTLLTHHFRTPVYIYGKIFLFGGTKLFFHCGLSTAQQWKRYFILYIYNSLCVEYNNIIGQPKWNISFTVARWKVHNEKTIWFHQIKRSFHIFITLSQCTKKWGISSVSSQYEHIGVSVNKLFLLQLIILSIILNCSDFKFVSLNGMVV